LAAKDAKDAKDAKEKRPRGLAQIQNLLSLGDLGG
jgi:hypothetical protein